MDNSQKTKIIRNSKKTMKCTKCKEEIYKERYFRAKLYCRSCYERTKYQANHVSEEQIKDNMKKARQRFRERKARAFGN